MVQTLKSLSLLGLFAFLLINVQALLPETSVAAESVTASAPAAIGEPQFRTICVWDFADGDSEAVVRKSAFHAQHSCRLSTAGKTLTVEGTGGDPYFGFRVPQDAASPSGQYSLKIVLTEPSNLWELFWGTVSRPGAYAEFSVRARADESNACIQTFDWNESQPLATLRLDPPDKTESWKIARIELRERIENPIVLAEKKSENGRAVFVLKNQSEAPQSVEVCIVKTGSDQKSQNPAPAATETFAPGKTKTVSAVGTGQAVEEFLISIKTGNGFAPFSAAVRLIDVDPKTDGWPVLIAPFGIWQIHPEGALAVFRPIKHGTVVEKPEKPTVVIAPLVRDASGVRFAKRIASNVVANQISANQVVLEYGTSDSPQTLTLAVSGNQLTYRLTDIDRPTFGPTVFALGEMTNASFPGLEMLEKGERSSSTLDIETSESDRSRPNRDWVTQTSMLICTDRGRVSVRWFDAKLQPEFAVPDFIDSISSAGRMSLEAVEVQSAKQTLEAQIVVDTFNFVEAIADDVRALYGDLPDVPAPPRSDAEQIKFCLDTFVNRMQDENGWGHCVEKHWGHAYFSDHASCIWRASEGQIPFPGKLFVNGGGHVNNPSIFFAANQAQRYLDMINSQAAGLHAQANKDPSFPYFGKYDRGHWEHTALGTCARAAFLLNQHAYLTADGSSRDAADRILQYMKRFSVPRGGQVWEMPLHTPDPLAGAYAILAYVRGYQLTGNKDYLREAQKWAITGIPFVYLRPVYRENGKPSELANCLYATIGVYGATNWKAPLWIGRPVQWIGTVYAYALTVLAPYDQTFDWNKLARGILVSAQYQQYPDGEFAGTLPDSVEPNGEPRHPWNINPSALMMIQWKLSGVEDNVTAISNPKYRVAGPFAMKFANPDTVEFLIPNWMEGKPFQIFVNGKVRNAVGGESLKLQDN